MAKTGKDSKKALTIPSLPPPTNPLGIPSVYCNNMEIGGSGMDVRMTFNEIVVDHGKISVERRANVVMSPMHFTAMMGVLESFAVKLKEQASQMQAQMEKAAAAKK